MRIFLFCLFCFSFGWSLISCQESSNKPEQQAKEKTDSTKLSSEVKVDVAAKKISFTVQFISNEKMLEVFACTEQGPVHETVFLIQPIGIKLQEAIKQLGLSEAIHWQYPLENGYNLTMGDKVLMKVYFDDKTESEAIYAEDILVYDHTETPSFLRGWSFKGDQQTVDGKVTPTADVEFSLINKGRKSSSTTLLLNPSNFFMIDEPEYKVAPAFTKFLKKLQDPDKKKATIILIPANEELIATENAKRYKDENGLLTKNIEIAKKIDILKKKFLNEQRKGLIETIAKGSAEGLSEAEKNKWVIAHQKLALESAITLQEINLLYHHMAKNEYNYLLEKMPKDNVDSKTFKMFAVEMMGFLTKEAEFKLLASKEDLMVFEAGQANQLDQKREHEIKRAIHLLNIDLQPLLFRQIAVNDQIQAESARLKDKDVVESQVLKDTFEKSIKRSKLEAIFFKAVEDRFLKKITYLNELIKCAGDESKMTDDKTEVSEAKVAVLNAVKQKLSIYEFAHQERIKVLKEYMKDDKKEEAFYTKKIQETETQLASTTSNLKDLQIKIEAKGKGSTLSELEEQFKEFLIVQ